MIELMLRVIIAIMAGTGCDMGKPVDYYQWMDRHPDYKVPMTLSTQDAGDWWLMSDDGEYILFKFAEPLEISIPTGQSHGECARIIE
jgi:hypothetical protein